MFSVPKFGILTVEDGRLMPEIPNPTDDDFPQYEYKFGISRNFLVKFKFFLHIKVVPIIYE